MVHEREDVVGSDSQHHHAFRRWRASGHLAGFSDPLGDRKDCKNRGRADHWPTVDAGSEVEFKVII